MLLVIVEVSIAIFKEDLDYRTHPIPSSKGKKMLGKRLPGCNVQFGPYECVKEVMVGPQTKPKD